MIGGDSGSTEGGILDGITVIDTTSFVTGGFASLMLANQGATVIKVERPGVGDDNRYSGPPFVEGDDTDRPGKIAAQQGESPYFWTINYDKKSIELNLKESEGKDVLYTLVEGADVFLENFRPGTAESLDVHYDRLKEHNEQLIYCSISAFGETGPWSDRPGYDLIIQGTSGIMDVTGPEGGDPVKVGLPQTDLITAMWAGYGIVGALFRREQTGEGERIELGMHDAALPWLTKQAGKVFAGDEPERMGTRDPVLAPYQSYPTSDGYINVACGNQKLWEELCDAIDRQELKDDPRFATNGDRVTNIDELESELSKTFRNRTTSEWVEYLADEKGLPVGPVNTVEEALENEQTEARGCIGSVDHPVAGEIPVLEHPIRFENADTGFDDAPPLLGEDTEEVLEAAGYSPEQIQALRRDGVIPDPAE